MRQSAVVLGLAAAISSQEPPDSPIRSLNQACVRKAKAIHAAAIPEASSVNSWEKVRDKRRQELRRMLGLYPWPQGSPLNPVVTGRIEKPHYAVEKLSFESLPDVYITANLYLPAGERKRRPAIVYSCGHAYSPYGAKVAYQKDAAILARNGYVVLAVDPIQIAETYAWHHGPSAYGTFDWYSRGYTPAGAEVWNAIRAIDYLETRPEVDPQKIGMTGRSGGGGASWMTAAVDDRVKAIVPLASIMTYASHLLDYTNLKKCDCMYFGNVYEHDMLHLGALVAPRPVYMIYGKKDPGFPSAFGEFEERIGRLYAEYGKPGAFRSLGEDAGHEGTELQHPETVLFFDRHLMGAPGRNIELAVEEIAGEDLLVFPKGAPKDARNYRLHQLLTPAATPARPASAAAWAKRRDALLADLKQHVFHGMGGETAVGSLPTVAREGSSWLQGTLITPDSRSIRVFVSRPKDRTRRAPVLLYIASPGETISSIGRAWTRVRQVGKAVFLVIYPTGVTDAVPDDMARRVTYRNTTIVGETPESLALKDSIFAARSVMADKQVDPAKITVMGRGVSAGLAIYAGILVPEIAQVAVADPPASHKQSPIFLHVLRYTDLPEAAALLLPRRLSFVGDMPEAYSLTKQIAAVLGRGDRVAVAMGIEGILDGRYDHGYAAGW